MVPDPPGNIGVIYTQSSGNLGAALPLFGDQADGIFFEFFGKVLALSLLIH
jgi:hypothetical protein